MDNIYANLRQDSSPLQALHHGYLCAPEDGDSPELALWEVDACSSLIEISSFSRLNRRLLDYCQAIGMKVPE